MMHQPMPPMHAGGPMVGVAAQYHVQGSPSRGASMGRANSNPNMSYHLSPQPHSNPRSKGGVTASSLHHHSGMSSHPQQHSAPSTASMSAANAAMMMAGGAMSHLPGGGNLVSSDIKPPKKPEKPMSSYMRFNKRVHEKIKAENPQMKMWDIAKIIGQMWRELPEHEKQVLNEEYEVEKSRYNEELKAYYNSPAYQTYLQLKNREKQLQEQHNAAIAADSRSLLNDSKMTITPAIDDEDLDEDGFGIKHLAAARYRRNNRLIMDIFNDFHVSTTDQPSVVTVSRLKALQAQVESLIEHENKYIDQLIELEKKHESRKRAIAESRKQFEEEWDRLSAKKFNWQTATETELDEIKSWFKATYGIDVGQSSVSPEKESEKDKTKSGQSSSEKSGTSSSSKTPAKSTQATPSDSTVSSESEVQAKQSLSSNESSLKESKEKIAKTSSASSAGATATNSSSSSGVSKTNEDNISSAINVVLQEHAVLPQSANTPEPVTEIVQKAPDEQEESVNSEQNENRSLATAQQDSQSKEEPVNQKEEAAEMTPAEPEAMDAEEVAEKSKDPDFVPGSEDSNMGLDEDSTDVPATSEDEDDERLNHSSDISSGERDE